MRVKITIGSIGQDGNTFSRNEVHDVDDVTGAHWIEHGHAEQIKELTPEPTDNLIGKATPVGTKAPEGKSKYLPR